MSSAVGNLKKPNMRGLLKSQIKINLITAIGVAIGSGFLMKFFYNDVVRRNYAEFYKNYDIEKEFHQMRNRGVFDSCKAD